MSRIAATDAEIAAATAYEDLHVPALFAQWSSLIAEAASLRPGQRVLDVACGTGILARNIVRHVGEDGFVAGLDANPGMLAVAERIEPSVDWTHGVAESLPYEDASFDAVVSQFGLMFFEDPTMALGEMLRILADDGSLTLAVWASLEDSEAYPVVVDMLERLAGPEAADALRTPFALGDADRLSGLVADAGVNSVRVTTHRGTARFPSIRTMVEADLRGWLPVMGVILEDDQIEALLDEAEQLLGQYVDANGAVAFRAPAHIVVGKR